MNLTVKKNEEYPSLLTELLSPNSLFSRDWFDLDANFPSCLGINIPPVNIADTDKKYTLDIAVPGLDRKDFTIEVKDHLLTISADKKEDVKKEKNEYALKEYSFDSFCRSFTLPEDIKEDKIMATYKDGILKIIIPKEHKEKEKLTHKISVR